MKLGESQRSPQSWFAVAFIRPTVTGTSTRELIVNIGFTTKLIVEAIGFYDNSVNVEAPPSFFWLVAQHASGPAHQVRLAVTHIHRM